MGTKLLVTSGLSSIEDRPYEVVERKGLGHPDTLADGLAEAISNEYSRYCLDNYGAILHHNVDKISFIGGLVDIGFGKGKLQKSPTVILNGRMSESFEGKKIDIKKLQERVLKNYLDKILPNLDTNNIEIEHYTNSFSHNPNWYHPRNIKDIPDHVNPHANDTSTCTSSWPLSFTEKLVLEVEKYFYTKEEKPKFDWIGQDIKIKAVRHKNTIEVVFCVPFISSLTPTKDFYREKLDEILQDLDNASKKILPPQYKVQFSINTADDFEKNDCYLLMTGSCIEAGEEGVVGRGNRSRGIISSTRPYSMEAPYGKNPVYHVGKVHTVLADSLSKTIAKTFNCEVDVLITTKNKDDLYSPFSVIVHATKKLPKKKVRKILSKHLDYKRWTEKIIRDELLLPKPGRGNTYQI